ncbi:MAG: DoxX family protein [Planctomycetota bacterium]
MRKPMRIVVGMLGVLGRILLCTVFLAAAVGYTASNVQSLALVLAAKVAVAPIWILVGAIVVLAVGCISVVVGYKARFGALVLLAFLVLTTYLFHGFTFWNVVNNQARHDHIIYLVMNLSIMGAMLLIVVNGAGQMSLDGKRR